MPLFLLVTIISGNFIYTFYLVSIAYHMGAFILALISYNLVAKFLTKENIVSLVVFFFLVVIAVINDRLFIAMFSLPLLTLLIIQIKKNPLRKRIYWLLIINVIASLSGLLIFKYIKYNTSIDIISLGWKAFNFENIIPALKVFLNQHIFYIQKMDFRGVINVIFIFSILIHLFLLVKKLFQYYNQGNSKMNELLYLLLFLACTMSILLAPIINGNYVSTSLMRYNIYSFYLGIFGVGYLSWRLKKTAKLKGYHILASIAVLLIIYSGLIFQQTRTMNIRDNLTEFFNYYPEKVKNLDSLSREYDLENGIASYWNAKYYMMFSREDVKVFTIFESLSPWYHVMNENWYYYEDGNSKQPRKFNFIIVENIDHKNIEMHLGIPADTLYLAEDEKIFTFRDFIYNEDTYRPYIAN